VFSEFRPLSGPRIPVLINWRFDRNGATNRDGDFHCLNFDSINALGMSGPRIAVYKKPTVCAAETGLPIQVVRTGVSLVGSNGIVTNSGLQDIVTSIFADVQIMLP
jgi:hypothetical protein